MVNHTEHCESSLSCSSRKFLDICTTDKINKTGIYSKKQQKFVWYAKFISGYVKLNPTTSPVFEHWNLFTNYNEHKGWQKVRFVDNTA